MDKLYHTLCDKSRVKFIFTQKLAKDTVIRFQKLNVQVSKNVILIYDRYSLTMLT